MFKATGKEFYPAYGIERESIKSGIIKFIEQQTSAVIYPHEIGVPYHGWVDVACVLSQTGEIYAFEVKERGDSISTGIEQCKGYQSAFDYTYIVGAVTPKKESLLRMEKLGIGYVQITFEDNLKNNNKKNAQIHCLLISPLNHPLPEQRQRILQKFLRYSDYTGYIHKKIMSEIKGLKEFVT